MTSRNGRHRGRVGRPRRPDEELTEAQRHRRTRNDRHYQKRNHPYVHWRCLIHVNLLQTFDVAIYNQTYPPRDQNSDPHSATQTVAACNSEVSNNTNDDEDTTEQEPRAPTFKGGRQLACPPLDEPVIAYIELRR